MTISGDTAFRSSHLQFAESLTETYFGAETFKYLKDKYTFYQTESQKSLITKLGFQVCHILLMPYHVASLALQTIADVAATIFAASATIITIGIAERPKHELKCRAYNFFVADVISWAALITFVRTWFIGANSLHLGTTRLIDKGSGTYIAPQPEFNVNNDTEYDMEVPASE